MGEYLDLWNSLTCKLTNDIIIFSSQLLFIVTISKHMYKAKFVKQDSLRITAAAAEKIQQKQ